MDGKTHVSTDTHGALAFLLSGLIEETVYMHVITQLSQHRQLHRYAMPAAQQCTDKECFNTPTLQGFSR